MKKCTVFLIIISLLAFSLTACSNDNDKQPEVPFLERPDTNLDFWIAENVDNVDFSRYAPYPLDGGLGYYGLGYAPAYDENGKETFPEIYVAYFLQGLPDISDEGKYITHITIKDPEIYIYGSLTVESSLEDFERLMEQNGFEIVETPEHWRMAKKGKFTIKLTPHHNLIISVEVENRDNVSY